MNPIKTYQTLGRSGLRVSPLCLGTMTFGTQWGWGANEAESRSLFDCYIEAGGNFIDTADGYTNGQSEEMLGQFIQASGLRDRIVLATKFSWNMRAGDPNAGGNGRKHICRAVESSLQRLRTDFIDVYWMHAWDTITPAEEVVSTLNDLVRQGKIRHYGLSDLPAWYVARATTLAEKEGKERPIALQLEYSLIERNIEREHIPAAQQFGMAVCPFSPIAMGFLAGKYRKEGIGWTGEGRLRTIGSDPRVRTFTDRNWRILDTLLDVSRQLEKKPAQVALNWVASRPGITSPIVGATNLAQLKDSLAAFEFSIPAELRNSLDQSSAPDIAHPYLLFGGATKGIPGAGVPEHAWLPSNVTGGPAD